MLYGIDSVEYELPHVGCGLLSMGLAFGILECQIMTVCVLDL